MQEYEILLNKILYKEPVYVLSSKVQEVYLGGFLYSTLKS